MLHTSTDITRSVCYTSIMEISANPGVKRQKEGFLLPERMWRNMETQVEQTLYVDPQAEVPAGYCPRCGGELYRPGLWCVRCGEAEA